ncbi:hypothetical protein [Candidatus Williamhamiltonella defendens]|uniref:hypothetical protein n=1 Tax=Candidatus Williamhamiltonella defendens TaxID=138072 RepID=UPI001F38C5FE|nr:hypothetical protein [Candidatus Hamiltonella defensa]
MKIPVLKDAEIHIIRQRLSKIKINGRTFGVFKSTPDPSLNTALPLAYFTAAFKKTS